MEEELRSVMVVNESPFKIFSLFRETPHVQQEIVYLANGRYKDGYVQQKRVLVRENRSFLPGIKTSYVRSLETAPHQSFPRFMFSQPGRSTARLLSECNEGSRKTIFYPSEGVSVSISVQHRGDGKPLTFLSCEVEHAQCRELDFIFKHPVGIQYRTCLTDLWGQLKSSIVVQSEVASPESGLLEYLTKPRHPDPTQLPLLLTTYTHYLKKLDGQPGSLYFHSHGQLLVLAEGRSLSLPSKNHLTYAWTDHLILRVEYMPSSLIIITDILQGAYGEVMSQLPYMYRHHYLSNLTDISPFAHNQPQPPTRPLTDTSDSDGILLLDAYTLTAPTKLKYTYTIDVVYKGHGTFESAEGTPYTGREENLVEGALYECTPLDPLQPLKLRKDKRVPDSDSVIALCRQLAASYTLDRLWGRDSIGVKQKVLKEQRF